MDHDIGSAATQLRTLLGDVVAGRSFPPAAVDQERRATFDAVRVALTEGAWEQAANARDAESGGMRMLVGLVEAAATVRPTPAFPLVEMFVAERLLTRLDCPRKLGRLVVADVTAPLRVVDGDGAETGPVVVPFGPDVDVVVYLEAGSGGDCRVRAVERGAGTWHELAGPDITAPRWELDGPPGGEVLSVLPAEAAGTVAAELVLLEAAEMLGCAQTLFDASVSHASTREQFGQHLSSMQVIRHRLADAHTQLESVRSLVDYGAWVADREPAGLLEFALMAKGLAGEHAWAVADEAIQLHGAIGFTWEMGLQHPAGRIISRSLSRPAANACLSTVGSSVLDRADLVPLVE